MTPSEAEIAAQIVTQAKNRGAGKTLCPSEVARALATDWRALMPAIRKQADKLAAAGEITVTQKGTAVQAQTAVGPIRLGLPHHSD